LAGVALVPKYVVNGTLVCPVAHIGSDVCGKALPPGLQKSGVSSLNPAEAGVSLNKIIEVIGSVVFIP